MNDLQEAVVKALEAKEAVAYAEAAFHKALEAAWTAEVAVTLYISLGVDEEDEEIEKALAHEIEMSEQQEKKAEKAVGDAAEADHEKNEAQKKVRIARKIAKGAAEAAKEAVEAAEEANEVSKQERSWFLFRAAEARNRAAEARNELAFEILQKENPSLVGEIGKGAVGGALVGVLGPVGMFVNNTLFGGNSDFSAQETFSVANEALAKAWEAVPQTIFAVVAAYRAEAEAWEAVAAME